MLAAPILNPIVLASTWVAYQGRGKALEMTASRAGLGLLIAVAAALAIGSRDPGRLLRARDPVSTPATRTAARASPPSSSTSPATCCSWAAS